MIKVYLITGFLGSGKTTFLKHRLSQTDKKTGVLMNEFGKISIDSIAFDDNDIELVELKNGSIFCSCLKENFITSLRQMLELDLDELYIESSGLADPSNMGNVLTILDMELSQRKYSYEGSICLVDGVFFKEELKKLVSVERQVKHSHLILINKADLITDKEASDIANIIRMINPKAKIKTIQHGKLETRYLEHFNFHIKDEDTTNTERDKPKSVILEFLEEPTFNQLAVFLDEVSEYFFRIKGYVQISDQWYKVDAVNDQIRIINYRGLVTNGYNKLVFLTSKGISSISQLAQVANREIENLYSLEM